MKKKIRGKFKEKTCIICNKKFFVRTNKKYGATKIVNVRSKRALTCSHACSKKYQDEREKVKWKGK